MKQAMRKNILLIGVIATAAYIIGAQSAARRGRNYEDLRHQVERLWNDPHARRSRKELTKKAGKVARQAARAARRRMG